MPLDRRLLNASQWALTLLVAGIIAWTLVERWPDMPSGVRFSPSALAMMSLATLGAFVLNGLVFQMMAGHFGSPLTLTEAVLLGFVSTTLQYVPMKAGLAVNGLVMRDRYGMRFAHWGVLLAGSNLVQLWLTVTVAGVLMLPQDAASAAYWTMAVVPTLVLIGMWWWGSAHPGGEDDACGSKLRRGAVAAIRGFREIMSRPGLVAHAAAVNAGLLTMSALRFYWAFRVLSVPIDIQGSVLLATVAIVTQRFSVLPGGFGVREGGVAAGAAAIGMPATLGLAGAMVDRAVMVVWLLAVGLPVTLYVMRDTQAKAARRDRGACEELELRPDER